ncbi:MFS transporter [Adhaeribacter aquaticus]|uniref:MFS transporter n=1 Tax=Adhaeribacter aquaticus TaxID=299567 RepID=UPI000428CF9C|nr:MFS transporter [Adhaeribacter aquaticus]
MKLKGLRWYIIGLISLSTVINFIDRSAINILWPYIHKEFGISTADSKSALAVITTFFLIAYALGQTTLGKVMDLVGTRVGMALSIAGWSIAIALHALARSLFAFSFFRFFLGLFEAGNWPGATKSNAEWFPARERAIAQALFSSSTAIGSIIAAPVIALLYVAFGWRISFILMAALGFLWIIPWFIVNKASPDKHPWLTDEEKSHIVSASDSPATVAEPPSDTVYTWRELLWFKNTWGILLGRFFIDPVWWLFITWMPTFLKEQFHLDIQQVGAYSWFPYTLAVVGGVLGGIFSMRQINAGVPSHKARKNGITLGGIFMLLALVASVLYLDDLIHYPEIIMVLIGITMFGFQFLICNLQTLPSDYFNGKNVGTVAGMAGTAAVVGTVFTTWAVPVITRTSYYAFFALGAVLVPLAWLCITFIASGVKPENK